MNDDHLSEEQLALHFYGDEDSPGLVEGHLSVCGECRASYQTLQRVLNSVESYAPPERAPDYEDRVWASLEAQLTPPGLPRRISGALLPEGNRRGGALRWLMAAAAITILLVGAFVAGRNWQRSIADRDVADTGKRGGGNDADTDRVRERVLLVAVGDHLERSQVVLVELANATAAKGHLDISFQQREAQDLLDENRLYRQTAANVGDSASTAMLEDLERALIEIAHSPSSISADELRSLRKQIEDQGLLVRVRAFGSRVENDLAEPGDSSPGVPEGKSSKGKPLISKIVED